MWSVVLSFAAVFIVCSTIDDVRAGSANPRILPPPPYWCAELRLESFVRIYGDGEKGAVEVLDNLHREHSPISVGTACVWNVRVHRARIIKESKRLEIGSILEEVRIHGRQCAQLKKGVLIKGILTAHETEQSGVVDQGTPFNKVLYFRECPCPKDEKREIPPECISWK